MYKQSHKEIHDLFSTKIQQYVVNNDDSMDGSLRELYKKRYRKYFRMYGKDYKLSKMVSDDEIPLLTSLPKCPQTTLIIHCENNYIEELPEQLPLHLMLLNCNHNRVLTKLPNQLPNTLIYIDCSGNNITELPNQLPHTLYYLNCSYNKLSTLPSQLPNSLKKLLCNNNYLIQLLEDLPPNLEFIDCHSNRITHLPNKLPIRLITLKCDNNKLNKLPEILPPFLQVLNIECQLFDTPFEIPKIMPPSLTFLNASYLKLAHIPDNLPSELITLILTHNEITSIDISTFPSSLKILDLGWNNITTIPSNLPSFLETLILTSNKITSIGENLPVNLQTLNLASNKLIHISDDLPSSLLCLNINNNTTLTDLPNKLPPHLKELYICNTNITSLACDSPYTRDYMGRPYKLSKLPNTLSILHCNASAVVTLPDVFHNSLRVIKCSDCNISIFPDIYDNMDTSREFSFCSYINPLSANYPKRSWNDDRTETTYINECNERRRTSERLAIINKDNMIWKKYIERIMHPKYFGADLIADENIDIDEHIKQYLESL